MATVVIAGLGPGPLEFLPCPVLEALQVSSCICLATEKHPVINWLKEKNITYKVFETPAEDSLFQKKFEQFFENVILKEVCTKKNLIYAVPGHPLIDDNTAVFLLKMAREAGLQTKIIPSISFADSMLADLEIDVQNCIIVNAAVFNHKNIDCERGVLITGTGAREQLLNIKSSLLNLYPENFKITACKKSMNYADRYISISVFKLDRLSDLACLYIPPYNENKGGESKNRAACSEIKNDCFFPLDPLVDVLEKLRGKKGCPWDREQTHFTLRPYLLEETYEVLEALNCGEMHKICEELGDLLLQVVFHAQLARENGYFDMNDIIQGITEKMIRRHPHVFGHVKVRSSAEVKVHWDEIKQHEANNANDSVLAGIPKEFPALLKAFKMQSKAAKVGFDWPNYHGAVKKVKEELNEVVDAVNTKDKLILEQEIGDLLFAVVNVARLLDVEPENALLSAIEKFKKRFNYIEQKAESSGKKLTGMSLEEMDALWEEAKSKEK